MKYLCYLVNGLYIGSVYAPNYETAVKKAVKLYGPNTLIEEV